MKTLREIADELQLARSTVSMCLSADLSRYRLSPETVSRVREYAEANGYVPNRLARKLSKSDSSAVGLIVLLETSSDKSSLALRMAMETLTAAKREFIVQNVPSQKLSEALTFLKSMRVRDIILFGMMREYPPSEFNVSARESLIKQDQVKAAVLLSEMRLFAVDYSFPIPDDSIFGENLYCWGIDRRVTYRKLFEELQRRGKRKIMCDQNSYRAFPEAEKYIPDERYVFKFSNNYRVYEQGQKFADEFAVAYRELEIELVVIHNDRSAIGFIDGLRKYGLQVPRDVQVIGFDNSEICDYYNPRLTSIGVPVVENTEMALQVILNNTEVARVQVKEADIFWRESAVLDVTR